MASPIDKGRAVTIIEKYESKETDQNGQPKMKNRYGTVGRATKWAGENGRGDNIEIDLEMLPVGASGKVKINIFWDSDNQDNQQQNNNQGQGQQYNQNQQQGYSQQTQQNNNNYQQQSRG